MTETTTIDKSKWSRGPWDSEPDHVEFEHVGLPCILHRVGSHSGHWCGYVAVPPGHRLHGKGYDDAYSLVDDLNIHGGLTYASPCQGSICHVPKPGEPDNVWWFGFDCAHLGDISPARADEGAPWDIGATYKTRAYVEAETRRLAERFAGTPETGTGT